MNFDKSKLQFGTAVESINKFIREDKALFSKIPEKR